MNDASKLSEPADIYRIVKSLQQARSFLSVKLANSSDVFTSIVLHTDFEKGVFVIDQLSPSHGNSLIVRKSSISVSGLVEGVPAIFDPVTYHMALQLDGNSVHCLNLPTAIGYNQRRQAFRINVPRSINSAITLPAVAGTKSLTGRVIDISASGLGCEFSEDALPNLEKGNVIANVHIVVGDVLDMTCDLICQYPQAETRTNSFKLGTGFCELNSLQEKAVAKTVLMLQQNARKLETKR